MPLPPISDLLRQYGGEQGLPSISELMREYGMETPEPPPEPGFYEQLKGYGAEAYETAKPVLRPLQGLVNIGGAATGKLGQAIMPEAYARAQQANLAEETDPEG